MNENDIDLSALRIYLVVASMAAGSASTVVWRFILGSPWQLSRPICGFGVAIPVLLVSLPLTRGMRSGRLFQQRDSAYHGSE